MRRSLPVVALLAALVFAAAGSAKTLFVVKGKGWGHGVGLSQWGAYGMARNGNTWQQIIAHYYRGTTIGERSGKVRVLLADGRSSVHIGSAEAFEVGQRTHAAGNPLVTPTANGRIRVAGFQRAFDSPVSFRPIDAPVKLNGSAYHGNYVVSVVHGRLRVVNAAGLEDYVKGVVTHESPAWWGDVGAQASIEAQAVAARSYALFTVVNGGGKCEGYLCPTTADQVYGPISSETANGRAATRATEHKVVLYEGGVAQTFFSSSSGGRTAASADTWGGDPGYLRSVDDPADLASFGANVTNPNRSWRFLFTATELGNRLGTPTPKDAVVSSRASGRVRSLTLRGPGWSELVSGDAPLRSPEYWRSSSSLGLKSGRFRIGVQALRADKSEVACNGAVRLNVFAHDVGSISVEQRRENDSAWTKIPLNKIDEKHWRATRHPCVSMAYRVKSDKATGPTVHVRVSPDVAFDASQRADALTGKVNPLLAGTPVLLERRTDSGWTLASVTALHADGSFNAPLEVEEGVYRARVVPPAWTGMVTGHSPALHVVSG